MQPRRETFLPLLMLGVGVGVGVLLAHPATQPSPVFCTADKFKCPSGECLNRFLVCDGYDDCEDRSDEKNCSLQNAQKFCNKERHFKCKSDVLCVPRLWVCDGQSDCADNSDEEDCPRPSCRESDAVPCAKNGEAPICVRGSWVCESDCSNGTDGVNCKNATEGCEPSDFSCPGEPICIPKAWMCDGVPDCLSGADENPELCNSTSCSVVHSRLGGFENVTFLERGAKKKFCLGNKEVNWLQALAQCRSLDMDLASISGSQEQEAVASLILAQHGYVSESLWLSGSDEDVPGLFQWTSNGDHVSYSNWFPGEPGGAPAHCMEMRRSDFKWRSYQCSHQQGFVCEYYARNNRTIS